MHQRMLVIILAAGGLVLGSGVAAAQATAPVPSEGTAAPNITKEQREQMKSESEAKRAAKAKMTPEEKKAADEAKRKSVESAQRGSGVPGSSVPNITKEQREAMKSEAAAKHAARAKMTPEQRKAADAEMRKEVEAALATCGTDPKAGAAAAKAAHDKMTPEELKALNAQKQKALRECIKQGGA